MIMCLIDQMISAVNKELQRPAVWSRASITVAGAQLPAAAPASRVTHQQMVVVIINTNWLSHYRNFVFVVEDHNVCELLEGAGKYEIWKNNKSSPLMAEFGDVTYFREFNKVCSRLENER